MRKAMDGRSSGAPYPQVSVYHNSAGWQPLPSRLLHVQPGPVAPPLRVPCHLGQNLELTLHYVLGSVLSDVERDLEEHLLPRLGVDAHGPLDEPREVVSRVLV